MMVRNVKLWGVIFYECLNHAPFLLPGEDTAIRPKLQRWLDHHHVHPKITGEFDDSALMKSFGQAGAGLFTAPANNAAQISKQYNVKAVGKIDTVIEQTYLITTERQLTNPAIRAISENSQKNLSKRK